MKKIQAGTLEIYQFENLGNMPGLQHAITTRKGGISEGFADSLNLGMGVDDHLNYVEENRRRLAEFMGVAPDRLIFQKQTHSTNYSIVTEENYKKGFFDNDALITRVKGMALAVLGADCVPLLLYDKKEKVIAVIHAGWKGTVNGIVYQVMDALKSQFHSDPENILVGIGPSICAENYEVGKEVVEVFESTFKNSDEIISNRHGDKAHVDLWLANKTWLVQQGVPDGNIEISGLCTYVNHDTFYSARYFKNKTGRFAGCMVLK
jgi:YfiH family protein